MNYHNITTDDMLNGSGIRVCLWCSGCDHYCDQCQNPQTWDAQSGIEFDGDAKEELFTELEKPYISGITFTGGDPFYDSNIEQVLKLIIEIKYKFPNKTIWIYTGYTWEEIYHVQLQDLDLESMYRLTSFNYIDVLVDGPFEKDKADVAYPWAGSTNQRVIDVKKSLQQKEVVLWEN